MKHSEYQPPLSMFVMLSVVMLPVSVTCQTLPSDRSKLVVAPKVAVVLCHCCWQLDTWIWFVVLMRDRRVVPPHWSRRLPSVPAPAFTPAARVRLPPFPFVVPLPPLMVTAPALVVPE